MSISVRNTYRYKNFRNGVEMHEHKLSRWREALGLPHDRRQLTRDEYERLFSSSHHADYLKRERDKVGTWKVSQHGVPEHLALVDSLTPEESAQLITCDLYRYDPPENVRRRIQELVDQMRAVTWGQLRDGMEAARHRRESCR